MTLAHNSFTPEGGSAEHHFIVVPDGVGHITQQLASLSEQYLDGLAARGLAVDSGVCGTFYISDASNFEATVRASALFQTLREAGMGLSIIQMPPGAKKVAFHAYHVCFAGGAVKQGVALERMRPGYNGVRVTTQGYEHIYVMNLLPAAANTTHAQTRAEFDALIGLCAANDVSLKNLARTWIYVSDIDNNYTDMSEARNAVFDANGLAAQSRFPASTGISGRTQNAGDRVMVDALIIKGVEPEQLTPVDALSHLNRTHEYEVRFERALKVTYGDRSHVFISGTASIGPDGEILHEGDVLAQAGRTLDNIEALLKSAQSNFEDMAYMTVYLRDLSDFSLVQNFLAERLPNTPALITHGHVCRPGWLIEIEGVAISKSGNPRFAPY